MPDLVEVLAARMSAADLRSLLLEVYRRRAENLAPADVLRGYEEDAFVRPTRADAVALLELDRRAFDREPAAP